MSQTASTILEDSEANFEGKHLPSGWRWAKLLEIADRLPTGTQYERLNCKTDGKIPVVDQSESGYMGFHDNEYGVFASEEQPVVTFANHTCAVRLHEKSFSLIQNVFPLKGKDGVDTRFLYWLLINRVPQSFYGGHYPKLVTTDLPLPPFPIQKRIAAILNEQMAAVEQARTAAEAQLKAAKDLPAVYLRSVFDSQQAQQWSKVKLGELLNLRKEVIHPRDYPKGAATFVGLEHIESLTGRRIGSVELEKSNLTGRKPQFYKGDIVYGYLRPYLNKVWIAEFDGLCSVDQYVYSVETSRVVPGFLVWFMRSSTYLDRAPIDTTPGQLPRIRTEEVATVEINLPLLAEQRRIVSAITKEITTTQQASKSLQDQLDLINHLPAALLRQAFTGKL